MIPDDEPDNSAENSASESNADEFEALDGLHFESILEMPDPRPIPTEFHSVFSGLPFQACSSCEAKIIAEPTIYLIQKVVRNADTIMEICLCMGCLESMGGEISEESRKTLENFWTGLDVSEKGADACLACDRGLEEGYDGAVMGFGDELLNDPIRVCPHCVAQVEENLSEETRRGGQDFIDRVLPGVPEDIPVPFGLFS